MLKLHIKDDEGKTTVVPFETDAITIGRHDQNTIQLTERNVSRFHARVFQEGGRLYIEDVSSAYGTKLNGVRIQEAIDLAVSDVVQIGDYKVQYREDLGARADARSGATAIVDLNALGRQTEGGASQIPNRSQALLHLSGPGINREFPVTCSPIVIGRTTDNDLQLDHRSVSQHHAELRFENGQYILTDLGSSNGITVNQEPYQQVVLAPGDDIKIGHVNLQFMQGVVSTPADPSQWETTVLPAAKIDPLDVEIQPAKSGKLLILAGVFLVASIVLGVMFVKNRGGDSPNDPATANTTKDKPEGTEGDGPKVAGDDAQTNSEADTETTATSDTATTTDSNIDVTSTARALWTEGKEAEALTLLKTAAEQPETAAEANTLLAEFKTTRQLREISGILEEGQYEVALKELRNFSPASDSSQYGDYVELKKKAIHLRSAQLEKQVKKYLKRQKFGAAKRTVKKIRALPGQDQIAGRWTTKIREAQDRATRRSPRPEQDGKRTKTVTKTIKKPPVVTSNKTANELYREARKLTYKNQPKAISLLHQAVKKRRGHFKSHKLLGVIYQSKGKKSKAIKHFQKALDVKNDPAVRQLLERLQN
jgi:pSer/pThr/pTyr-binding forkhead associated (FHA) protein